MGGDCLRKRIVGNNVKEAGQPELSAIIKAGLFCMRWGTSEGFWTKKQNDIIYVVKNHFYRWVGNIRQGKKSGNQVGNYVSNLSERWRLFGEEW